MAAGFSSTSAAPIPSIRASTSSHSIRRWSRGRSSRVTFDPSTDWFPAWMPDSARLLFGSTREGATDLYEKSAQGSGDETRMVSLPRFGTYPNDVSRDGRFALFHVSTPRGYD